MKAIVYHQYGQPDVLQLEEVPQPVPKEGEVLVKIQAASINAWDWDLLTGKPYIYRLLFGLFKPKHPIIGSDFAGLVEAVGSGASQFKPGDKVYGDISEVGFGAFAEYACAPENLLSRVPEGLSFEEAAAAPQAAILALQGLQYNGGLQPGQQVLINGAGGGVGAYGIQMAKHFGAEVTAVDHAGNLDMMRSLGADHVINYHQEDFTKTGRTYDLVIDNVLNRSLSACRRVLKPGGAYGVIGGKALAITRTALLGSLFSNYKMGIVMFKPNQAILNTISKLFESGHLKSVIDRTFEMEATEEAMRHYASGNFKGKIVIKMA